MLWRRSILTQSRSWLKLRHRLSIQYIFLFNATGTGNIIFHFQLCNIFETFHYCIIVFDVLALIIDFLRKTACLKFNFFQIWYQYIYIFFIWA